MRLLWQVAVLLALAARPGEAVAAASLNRVGRLVMLSQTCGSLVSSCWPEVDVRSDKETALQVYPLNTICAYNSNISMFGPPAMGQAIITAPSDGHKRASGLAVFEEIGEQVTFVLAPNGQPYGFTLYEPDEFATKCMYTYELTMATSTILGVEPKKLGYSSGAAPGARLAAGVAALGGAAALAVLLL